MITENNTVIKGNNSKTLVIFDLDMTLVISRARIKIIDGKTGKEIKSLTPEEFNDYEEKTDEILDFTDFQNPEILSRSKLIYKIFRQLRKFYNMGIPVCILTARSSSEIVRDFFLDHDIDIHKELVIAVNDSKYNFNGSVENKKQQAIIELIDKGFEYFTFYDDHIKNLTKAKELEKLYPVKISIFRVK